MVPPQTKTEIIILVIYQVFALCFNFKGEKSISKGIYLNIAIKS